MHGQQVCAASPFSHHDSNDRTASTLPDSPPRHAPAASAPTSSSPRKHPHPAPIRAQANTDTSCWDGQNLDSVDHKSHVAYPVDGPPNFLSLGGACPSTHPVRIPQLMYEVVWDTTPFNDPNEWPEDGSQPFYLSTGDNTGFGQHADYVFGWKDDSLQRAMDTSGCFGAQCANLPTQAIDVAKSCKVGTLVNEDVDGCEFTFSFPGGRVWLLTV